MYMVCISVPFIKIDLLGKTRIVLIFKQFELSYSQINWNLFFQLSKAVENSLKAKENDFWIQVAFVV